MADSGASFKEGVWGEEGTHPDEDAERPDVSFDGGALVADDLGRRPQGRPGVLSRQASVDLLPQASQPSAAHNPTLHHSIRRGATHRAV